MINSSTSRCPHTRQNVITGHTIGENDKHRKRSIPVKNHNSTIRTLRTSDAIDSGCEKQQSYSRMYSSSKRAMESAVYLRRCSCHFAYTGNRGNVRQIIYWPTILSTAWWIITDAVRSHMYAQQGLWHGRVWVSAGLTMWQMPRASGLRGASGSR